MAVKAREGKTVNISGVRDEDNHSCGSVVFRGSTIRIKIIGLQRKHEF
jgi:hypothetical protein